MISSESAVRRSPDGNEGNDPAVRLLAAITSAQKKALGKHDAGEIFEAMLEETLALTASAFGFMGEVFQEMLVRACVFRKGLSSGLCNTSPMKPKALAVRASVSSSIASKISPASCLPRAFF